MEPDGGANEAIGRRQRHSADLSVLAPKILLRTQSIPDGIDTVSKRRSEIFVAPPTHKHKLRQERHSWEHGMGLPEGQIS